MFKQKLNFRCFSPTVMAITVIVELSLLAYTLYRRKFGLRTFLASAILFCLAMFQIAEYGLCEGLLFNGQDWSRIGFVAISALPVLGLHLILDLANKTNKYITTVLYSSLVGWAAIFVFGGIVEDYLCGGNYVIFRLSQPWGVAYFSYYYLLLLIGIGLSIYLALRSKNRKSLLSMAAGYLVFLVPTTVVTSIYSISAEGVTSIMCGFAVGFAIILALYTLPKSD